MTTRTQTTANRTPGSGTAGTFGRLLRQWRERRRLSQLGLAVDAEISSRHLSFLSYPDVPQKWRTLDLDAAPRVECFFPADRESETLLRNLGDSA